MYVLYTSRCKTWVIEMANFMHTEKKNITQIIAKSVLKRKVVITNFTCEILNLNYKFNALPQ